jgi:hypothetical protein
VSGVLLDANAPNNDRCRFELQRTFSPDIGTWETFHTQELPSALLAPAAFAQTVPVGPGTTFVRVRWLIFPNPGQTLAAGVWFAVSAYLNTGLDWP